MKTIAEKQQAARAEAEKRRAQDDADMLAVAKLFSTEEGKHVLDLLFRKFGVLRPRFELGKDGDFNALRAARRDGRTDVPLFIVECLQAAGEKNITFPI